MASSDNLCAVCGKYPRRGNSATCDDECSDKWNRVTETIAQFRIHDSYELPDWLAELYFRLERLEARLRKLEGSDG